MKKVLGTLVFVFICLIFSVLSTSAQTNEGCKLPNIEYLGQGKNVWVLGQEFDGFVVKETRPFNFMKVNGPDYETMHNNDRVWQSTYFTNTLNFVYAEEINIGYHEANTKLLMVIVDDDVDDRHTVIIDSNNQIHQVIEPNENLVTYIEFNVSASDTYTIKSSDSIGFIYGCSVGTTSLPIMPEPVQNELQCNSLVFVGTGPGTFELNSDSNQFLIVNNTTLNTHLIDNETLIDVNDNERVYIVPDTFSGMKRMYDNGYLYTSDDQRNTVVIKTISRSTDSGAMSIISDENLYDTRAIVSNQTFTFVESPNSIYNINLFRATDILVVSKCESDVYSLFMPMVGR